MTASIVANERFDYMKFICKTQIPTLLPFRFAELSNTGKEVYWM